MHYYTRHIGDYCKDTQALSLVQHGVYQALLDHQYATERPLPKNWEVICRICRASTKAEREAVTEIVATYFQETPDGYVNKRAWKEIEAHHARSERNAENVNARWQKTKKQNVSKSYRKNDTTAVQESGPVVSESYQQKDSTQYPVPNNQEPCSTPSDSPQGGEQPEAATLVTLEMALAWAEDSRKAGSTYTDEETSAAWAFYQMTRFADGAWRLYGNSPTRIVEWCSALERQIQHARNSGSVKKGGPENREGEGEGCPPPLPVAPMDWAAMRRALA